MSKFKLGDKVVLELGVFLLPKTITYVHYNADGQFEYELDSNVVDRYNEYQLHEVHFNPKYVRLQNFGVALLCKTTNRIVFNTISPVKTLSILDWRYDDKNYDMLVIDYD